MDVKDLKYFCKIYENKSINKTSQEFFITPQGLSKIIKNLEYELDTTLFNRNKKGVTPTKSGDFLYKKSQNLIDELERIKLGIKQIKDSEKKLKIGCACGFLNTDFFNYIINFIKKNEDTEVLWQEYINEEVKQRVLNSQIDIGFIIGDFECDEILKKTVLKKEISLLVYENHKFYNKEFIEIKDLKDERLITLNEKFECYNSFMKKCLDCNFKPNIVAKTMESRVILKLCKSKMGLGIDVAFDNDDYKLSNLKPIKFKEPIIWKVNMIYKKENELYPNIQKFYKYIQKYVKK